MFNVGLPHFIASSMRMAHIVSEMSSFIANSTSSHDSTSLEHIKSIDTYRPATKPILTETAAFCKQNLKKFEIFYEMRKLLFSFYTISGTMAP